MPGPGCSSRKFQVHESPQECSNWVMCSPWHQAEADHADESPTPGHGQWSQAQGSHGHSGLAVPPALPEDSRVPELPLCPGPRQALSHKNSWTDVTSVPRLAGNVIVPPSDKGEARELHTLTLTFPRETHLSRSRAGGEGGGAGLTASLRWRGPGFMLGGGGQAQGPCSLPLLSYKLAGRKRALCATPHGRSPVTGKRYVAPTRGEFTEMVLDGGQRPGMRHH